MKTINIGIIGNGFVGQATSLFRTKNVNVLVYDVDPDKCVPVSTTLKMLVDMCHIIFICVPTPMCPDGSCHTGIVEIVVQNIKNVVSENKPFIIVRSTVPPGTCSRLGVYHMPEFLTEKNWVADFKMTEKWIVGLCSNDDNTELFKSTMLSLFEAAYENGNIYSQKVVFVDSSESELIKYTRNAFLAVKVSFCNEIARYCESLNISYNVIREHFPDHRITSCHTNVPGYDGHNGYGGTCLPKDTQALAIEMKKRNLEPHMLEASIKRNITIDRPEKDWSENKGRTVLE